MGYGVGEYVAATVAEVFSLEDGLKLLMESNSGEFERIAKQVIYSKPRIALVSSLTGELVTTQVATPEYWCYLVRQPVNFVGSMNNLAQQGYEILVEVGLVDTGCVEKAYFTSLHSDKDEWQQLLENLATLYVRGAKIDWLSFDRYYSRQRVQLPTYPWQRKRYWFGDSNYRKLERNSQSNGQSSTTKFIGQLDIKQLIEQLEINQELSPEELNLLPGLLELLTKQYQPQIEADKFIATTEIQQIHPKLLTAADIQAWLVEQIAKELGVKPEDINVRVPFDSYGLDSVLAIGIASAGKQFLGLDVSPLLLVHYPTIESLSQHLAKQLETSDSEIFEI
ncbi:hypothetical protein I8752_36110 [Nostocaceae cyanobacterium CENA369]|uniref:Carrier domain-containing protein n=2 Tax=Dendronalium TaxID=2840442 RepID=A0A8J7IPI8_9NOST|nr:hypothetical protein [Dendronalium phyllosphericum CENA369]